MIVKKPGRENADHTEPYGKRGFGSLQWWYALLVQRPERIAVMWTTAPV